MPTYTYRCNHCGHQFDIRQRMSDEPLTNCPQCHTEKSLRKVLNSVGIVFKGNGFYVTDNRGKKPATASATNGKSSSNGDGVKPETAEKEKSSSVEKKPAASSEVNKKASA